MDTECFLCRSSSGGNNLRWQDRPLWLDPRAGFVIPGIGGLSPGYVLVAPLEHHINLCQAASILGGSFLSFISDALVYLEERLGVLTFWEHGAPLDQTRPSAACIDHAHLHVAAGNWDLPEPPQASSFPSLRDALVAEAAVLSRDGYLLLGWSGGNVHVGADTMVSQYYRREWARLTGNPDHWDYLIAEDSDITAATIRLLHPPIAPGA
jgi:hypothetical protein